jgi:hypothetical protein
MSYCREELSGQAIEKHDGFVNSKYMLSVAHADFGNIHPAPGLCFMPLGADET